MLRIYPTLCLALSAFDSDILKQPDSFSGYDLESPGFWLLKSQLPSAQNNASLGIRKTNLANLLYGGFLLAATGL